MAGHNFNYRVNGTTLASLGADNVRLAEGIAGKRAQLLETAYKHGVYVASRHWTKARLMRLDVLLPGGTPSAIYTAKQAIEGALAGAGVATLTRNDPVHGDVQCRMLVMDPVEQPVGRNRFQWQWPVWQLDGYWEDATESSEVDTGLTTTGTIGPITLGGNHPTSPRFSITCQTAGDDPTITDANTGDEIALPGSFAASDVIVVDIPNRLVTLNGTRAKALYKPNRGYWMEWDPNDSPISLTWAATSGTWDVTTYYRERHRG